MDFETIRNDIRERYGGKKGQFLRAGEQSGREQTGEEEWRGKIMAYAILCHTFKKVASLKKLLSTADITTLHAMPLRYV